MILRTKTLLIVWLISVVLLACAGIATWTGRSQASSRAEWEYRIVGIEVYAAGRLGEPERTLNQLGAEGWEFVQFIHTDEVAGFQGKYLFKRPK
jgi:hypothetical protein